MNRRRHLALALALCSPFLGAKTSACSAEENLFVVPPLAPAIPRDDAAALARLAPASNGATSRASYGDSRFASGYGDSHARRVRSKPQALSRPGCGTLTDLRYRCTGPASAFFQRKFVFTPSYVSAPQVFARPQVVPRRQAPSALLHPVTSFFLDPFRPGRD